MAELTIKFSALTRRQLLIIGGSVIIGVVLAILAVFYFRQSPVPVRSASSRLSRPFLSRLLPVAAATGLQARPGVHQFHAASAHLQIRLYG